MKTASWRCLASVIVAVWLASPGGVQDRARESAAEPAEDTSSAASPESSSPASSGAPGGGSSSGSSTGAEAEPESDWVETITVIGSGSDGGTLGGIDLKELPVSSMIVNRQEIARIKFVDPDEFLDRIPGESQVRNLRIPQGGKSYTTPLVDGLPLGSPYRGATQDITDVNSFDIERIEIIKGPASALYASNSFGGTINVITRVPPQEREARVWIEGGDFSRVRAGAHATGTIGDVGYFVDANTQEADGLRETFQNNRDQLSAKAIYSPTTATRLIARGERIDRDEVFPGDLLQSEFDQDPSQVGRVRGANEEVESTLLSLKLEQRIGSRGLLEAGHVSRNEESVGIARFSGPNATELDDTTLKIMYGHDFGVWGSRLIVGFERFEGDTDFRAFDLDANGSLTDIVNDSSDSGVDIMSYFGQYSFTPREDLTVTLGLRSEDVELTSTDRLAGAIVAEEFSKTVPKLGATYSLSDAHQVWGNYAEGFLTPDLDDLFIDRNANPNLRPEEAQNTEVGFRGAVGMLRYEASIYHTDITNFIVSEEIVDEQGNELLSLTNAGQVNVRGLEAVVEYQVSRQVSLGLSYTYARNVYDRFIDDGEDLSGNRISRSPDHHINLRAAYFPIDRLAVELEVDTFSGYFTNDDNDADPLGKFTRDERINLRVAYDFGPWQFWVHGLNLTDTLEDRVGFSRGRRTIRIIDGRNIYAGIGFRF